MKRNIFTLLLAVLLIVSILTLSACNAPGTNDPDFPPTSDDGDEIASAKMEDLDISADKTLKYLPAIVEAKKFETIILKPIIKIYQDLLLEYDPTLSPEEYDFFAADSWYDVDLFEDASPVYESSGFVNTGVLKGYMDATSDIRTDAKIAGFYGYENMQEIADTLHGFFGQSTYNLYDAAYWIDIYNNADEFDKILAEGVLNKMFRNFPITGKWDGETPVAGTPIYALSSNITGEGLIEYEKYNPLQTAEYCKFLICYTDYEPKCLSGSTTAPDAAAAPGEMAPTEGLAYRSINNGTEYEFCGVGKSTDKNIVIASTYNNLPVTSISPFALVESKDIESIIIPNSITNISEFAFYDCTSVISVSIGNSVSNIGNRAFYNCKSLTSIIIPDSVTSINISMFSGCKNLTDIYFTGTEEEWNLILIDSGNENPINATIHFNHVPEN